MPFRIQWKTGVLTFALIVGPVLLSMMSTSCDNKISIFEIINQETISITEGKYSDVLIQIRYIPIVVGTAWAPNTEAPEALYATSPAPPRITNKVSELSITMNETFSGNYPAFSELISLFKVVQYPDMSIPAVTYPVQIDDNWSLYLYLQVAPDVDINTKFNITTTMDNGRVITTETTFITILK